MNVELLTRVALWLEAGAPHVDKDGNKVNFNMKMVQATHRTCGTTCCIAGYAALLVNAHIDASDYLRWAAANFDLDRETTKALCYPFSSHSVLVGIKPDQAARTIRHLIATGEVKWDL